MTGTGFAGTGIADHGSAAEAAERPPGEQDGAMPAPEAGSVPDGLRLQLTLPGQGSGLAGTLTLDWLQPTLTRERY